MSDEISLINFGGFFGLLTIALIALKLTGHIAISWWWVFAPLAVSILLPIVFIIVFILVMVIFG